MTIDTNILIAYLGGEPEVVDQIKTWKQTSCSLFISSVAECEILSYPKLSLEESRRIALFLSENFIILPFDSQRAKYAAAIRRIIHSLKLPDAAIAALAAETGTSLVTRNVRDFQKIPNLQIIKI